jgi:hypothetical protein
MGMPQLSTTAIYEPSRFGSTSYVAAVFDPDGVVQTSRSFSTRELAEAFLQAFMQESAGEYGLVHDKSEE